MPISFLDSSASEKQQDPKLKARLLAREFASHRYGLFKESGFRNDFMYPPFASLAGLSLPVGGPQRQLMLNRSTVMSLGDDQQQQQNQSASSFDWPAEGFALRGFDSDWNECPFDTQASNGLPTSQSADCLPYLTRVVAEKQPAGQQHSFNLMAADPFSHADLSARFAAAKQQQGGRPIEWRHLQTGADQIKWHFCGDSFAKLATPSNDATATPNRQAAESHAHNQLANNKQNVLCQEKSAMEIIKASEDFKRTTFSPSTFNRLPAPQFSFLQEMPPRVILCVEYAAHLFQSRRLDHGILEAAIGKFFAYDLIADSEIALVLFGQRNSSRQSFERLDASIKSRLTLYNPAIDPFDEPVRYYGEQELAQLFSSGGHSTTSGADINQQSAGQTGGQLQAKIVKGTCSFAKLMQEVAALQQQRSHQYDDIGADIVIISSGLFVEEEQKIEEIIRAQFRPDSHQINLIIYPSTLLFDTKSHDGFIVLDALESEAIVKNRLGKLLLLQRLTGANIHLVKEHLDANGDVKMSTLIQFYQIFDQISKGHSWDQQQSTMLLAHDTQVETARQSASSHKLNFQFQLDASVQNELIVAFIDPKQHQQTLKPGKRFAIRNLQLRSPGGQLVLTDSHPWPMTSATASHHPHLQHRQSGGDVAAAALDSADALTQADSRAISTPVTGSDFHDDQPGGQPTGQSAGSSSNIESALFPFRTQLGLAGFHLKSAHLALLLNNTNSNKISGIWTLSATSDEQLQTSAIAMGRVNPAGDTLTSNCWIQTYYGGADDSQADSAADSADQAQSSRDQQLRSVKVFAQTRGPAGFGPIQEVLARLEVHDEMGNIVQNSKMLDDGLGSPDITRGDGIHSQWVQRAYRPGFYKVSVEMTGAGNRPTKQHKASSGLGQDGACCGSFVPPASGSEAPNTEHLSRQLYCGTFYVEPSNRLLGQQRPARINNLTIVNVDQELRRVTLRWFEPSADLLISAKGKPLAASDHHGSLRFARSASRAAGRKRSSSQEEDFDDDRDMDASQSSQAVRRDHQHRMSAGSSKAANQQEPGNRYEIKLFSDRDMLKRAFDATKPEVGYKFSEQNVVLDDGLGGGFPNASASYGGMKEVTLRLPAGQREGIYYIAMKVYNIQLGVGSQLSNIVQLWVRSNLTDQEELELRALFGGQPITVDGNGNVYDKNGELIGQRPFGQGSNLASSMGGIGSVGSGAGGSNGLLRGSNTFDGASVLLFFSVCALLFSFVCISLVACLVSSARRSMAAKQAEHLHDDNSSNSGSKHRNKGKRTTATAILTANGGGGSGSSMVSSSATSQCEAASSSRSSATGSIGGGGDMNKPGEQTDQQQHHHLSYSQLRHQHQVQQHQADQIKNAYLDQRQQQQYAPYAADKSNWLQHTIVNGYAYATVASPSQQQFEDLSPGDLNQNGLGTVGLADSSASQQQWPSEVQLLGGHYDQLKRHSTASPMTFNQQPAASQLMMNGLPQVPDEYVEHGNQNNLTSSSSYLISSRNQPHKQLPSYFNQQLQQQLSSVLKSKQRVHQQQEELGDADNNAGSSPALEGVAQEGHDNFDNYLVSAVPPPPAQYIYQCTEANIQSSIMNQDPSIYSQATGLQQVQSSAAADEGANHYYANHHQYSSHPAGVFLSASNNNDPYNQQQQPDFGLPAESCSLEESYDKPNSAISEV